MNHAKIQLSTEEKELIQNGAILLTKNRILDKVAQLLGELSGTLVPVYDTEKNPFRSLFTAGAKLSRGEQYEGLPYFMLDYPRLFGKEDCLAVRTFFWWGNYFSVTLHMKGIYWQSLQGTVMKHSDRLRENRFRISLGGDEWMHDLRGLHWEDIPEKQELEKRVAGSEYGKISRHIPFDKWDRMPEELRQLHELIGGLLEDQLPKR